MSKAAGDSWEEGTAVTAEAEHSIMDSPKWSVDNETSNSNKTLERHFSIHKCYGEDETNDLKVYCANMHMGCEWTGNLTDVVEHMNYECQYSPVSLLLDENVEMPMIIMMRDFEQMKRNDERWYSPVFCTHEKGYHIRLRVDANGWCGNGDSIAVVVSIVKGDYDDQLQWPFEGVISVQVLNHISNSAHFIMKEFEFSGGDTSVNKLQMKHNQNMAVGVINLSCTNPCHTIQ